MGLYVDPLPDAATHTVVASHCRQAPDPLQKPSVPQVDGAVAAHSLSGSVPPVTGLQSPFVWPVLALEHAWHAPPHADSQQTLSTQLPLLHSPPTAQVVPLGFWATQVVPEQ